MSCNTSEQISPTWPKHLPQTSPKDKQSKFSPDRGLPLWGSSGVSKKGAHRNADANWMAAKWTDPLYTDMSNGETRLENSKSGDDEENHAWKILELNKENANYQTIA